MPQFNESDHPRAENGQFGPGGGAAGENLSAAPEEVKSVVSALETHLKGIPSGLFEEAHLVGSFGKDDPERAPDRRGAGTSDIDLILTPAPIVPKPGEKMWEARARARDERTQFIESLLPKLKGISNGRDVELHESDGVHEGSKSKMIWSNGKTAADGLAIDRATVRLVDKDGRLHVETTPISKANVCGYFGREIPRCDELGLDPDRLYQLLRDPGELAKGAATFNNLPLLCDHVPHSADEPLKELVIGATGSDAEFKAPYLNNSLVVWDSVYIDAINSHEQKELSSSYYYDADMTPGVYEGVPYDGRMINIVGNHVALVKIGRAGADVAVSDSLPAELHPMKKRNIAVAIAAALGATLRPMLAQDSVPQLRDLVRGNKTPAQIAADAKAKFGDKVDEAKLAGILQVAADEAAELDPNAADDEDEDDKEDKDKKAKDEDDEDEKAKKAKDEVDQDGKEKDDKKGVKAMDSVTILAQARDQARAESRALRQAERDVASLVGELPAMDSAEQVYSYALTQLGVDHKGVHASALPAMVKLAKDAKSYTPSKKDTIAMDAESVNSFDQRFPNRANLRSV